MYDQKYVIPGIIILLLLFFSPLLYDAAVGAQVKAPELAKAKGTNCVENAKLMEATHMELLNKWRELRMREGRTVYKSEYGTFNISLEKECFKCHTSEKKFCEKCHNYAGVRPYCWKCHITPDAAKELEEKRKP